MLPVVPYGQFWGASSSVQRMTASKSTGIENRNRLSTGRAAPFAAALLLAVALPQAAFTASAAPATGWQGATLAENVDGLRIMEPQIAIDANGQAMAVWYQYSAGGEIVWANRMVPGSGWGSPVRISAAIAGNPYIYPRVAAAGNGDMFAVWEQPNATVASVWSNRFVAGWGWGNATPIEVNTAGDAHAPQVAADTNGNAIA